MENEINYNELFGLGDSGGERQAPDAGAGGDNSEQEPVDPPDSEQDGRNTPSTEGAGEQGGGRPQNPDAPTASPAGNGGEQTPSDGNGERASTLRPQARFGGQPPGTGGSWAGDDADIDSVIRGLGITDPYTGKAVTTRAEYGAYKQKAWEERRDNIKRRSGMTDAELDEFINSTPAVQKAMADSAAAREFIARQRQAEAKKRMDVEVAKIAAMDPDVKTLADLTDKEYSPRLTELVKRGYDISDAYLIANHAALQRSADEASRQAAYNAQSGKSGMKATKQSGQGNDTVPVPADVKEIYQALNPGASDEEIRKSYNEYMKGRK